MENQFGLSEQEFAYVFAGGAVGLIGATQLNLRLLRRWAPQRILAGSLIGTLVFAVVLVFFAATGIGGLFGVLVPLWLVLTAVGLAMPNAPALALSRHGEAAGTAAALLGAVQFGVGALSAPLVGVLGAGAGAMAAVVLAGTVAANLVLWLVVRPHRMPAEEIVLDERVMVAAH
jgi:DHA1 family bicyclomycin/chloramphenicol resistance-like MFS transporter